MSPKFEIEETHRIRKLWAAARALARSGVAGPAHTADEATEPPADVITATTRALWAAERADLIKERDEALAEVARLQAQLVKPSFIQIKTSRHKANVTENTEQDKDEEGC